MARDIEKQIRLQLDEAGYTADKVTFRCVIEEKKRAWTFILHDLTVAGYYQYGEGNFNGLDGIENGKFVKYHRYGGGIAYNGKHAFARSEYIRGNTGALVSKGAYASAGWKFHTAKAGYGSVGVRFDYFDEDVLTKQREFNYTIGAAYQPWKYMRLQLNYTIKQYQHFNQPLTHSLMAMVSGIF